MMNKISGIYKITNPTGKIYVGSAVDIHKRWSYYNRLDCKKQHKLFNSFLKYGPENHIFEILEECTFENLYPLERSWGLFFNTLDKEKGLNLALPGYKEVKGLMSEETKLKISIANRGKVRTEKQKQIMSEISKSMSQETKDKISKTQIGRKLSEETKKKISDSTVGKTFSQETRIKMSLASKGKPKSLEAKLKMSTFQKNKVLSEDTKLKMSIAKKGHIVSEETKLKISKTKKEKYESI